MTSLLPAHRFQPRHFQNVAQSLASVPPRDPVQFSKHRADISQGFIPRGGNGDFNADRLCAGLSHQITGRLG
jgi:hypothetical protein